MTKISRIGDLTIGNCEKDDGGSISGVIITGASISDCEGQNIARIGDIVLSSCGHTGVIITGASISDCEGQNIARIGDNFSGTYSGVIITGASISDCE